MVAPFRIIAMSPLLTAKQAALLLNISAGGVYRLARENAIPYIRLGNKYVRFSQEAIEEWVKYNPVHESAKDTESQAAREQARRSNVVGGLVRTRPERRAATPVYIPGSVRRRAAEICRDIAAGGTSTCPAKWLDGGRVRKPGVATAKDAAVGQ